MSEVDEGDPFEGLVTSSALESQREAKHYDNEFSKGQDEPPVELSRPDSPPPPDDGR